MGAASQHRLRSGLECLPTQRNPPAARTAERRRGPSRAAGTRQDVAATPAGPYGAAARRPWNSSLMISSSGGSSTVRSVTGSDESSRPTTLATWSPGTR